MFNESNTININANIRWHQKQLTPRSYAYVYATPGLHSYKRDIGISIIKWKRFLFLMLMFMLMSLSAYTSFAYAHVYAYAYCNVFAILY